MGGLQGYEEHTGSGLSSFQGVWAYHNYFQVLSDGTTELARNDLYLMEVESAEPT